MKGTSPEQRARYLLGTASEAEIEALEAEYFTDDESFDRLDGAEDELFEVYLAGRLSSADEERFRERYLSSAEGLGRLAVAQALQRRSREALAQLEAAGPGSGHAGTRWLAIAAGLLVASVAAWLAWQNAALRREVERLRAEIRQASPSPTTVPTPPATHPDEPRTAMQAVKLPARPPQAPVALELQPGTRSVRLEIPLRVDEASASVDVVIRNAAGTEVWREEGLVPRQFGAPVVVTAPAEVLADGQYVLSLEGEPSREAPQRPPHQYRLRVVRAR